jgi:3-oxoacyl-(acyl-carrier-protein) synthase
MQNLLDMGIQVSSKINFYFIGDAFHLTRPQDDGDGAFRAMKAALSNGNICII